MVSIEALKRIGECIRLVELKRVMYLWFDVHSDNLKTGTVITHRCTTGTAEQIKQSRFHLPILCKSLMHNYLALTLSVSSAQILTPAMLCKPALTTLPNLA